MNACVKQININHVKESNGLKFRNQCSKKVEYLKEAFSIFQIPFSNHLVDLVPLVPFSQSNGQPTQYSNRLQDFSVSVIRSLSINVFLVQINISTFGQDLKCKLNQLYLVTALHLSIKQRQNVNLCNFKKLLFIFQMTGAFTVCFLQAH